MHGIIVGEPGIHLVEQEVEFFAVASPFVFGQDQVADTLHRFLVHDGAGGVLRCAQANECGSGNVRLYVGNRWHEVIFG